MKNNAIIRIILWSLVIVILLGLMLSFMGGVSFFRNIRTSNMESEAGEVTPVEVLPSGDSLRIPADQIMDIEIEWAAGSILIQPADVEEIEISETEVSDEKYAMRWKHTGNKLTIQFCEETFVNSFGINNFPTKDLTIFVPQDWSCDSLEIDAASATLEVNDLTIREVEIDTASGTCNFDNCDVNKLDLDTASGDVRFVGSLDILDCDAASASVYAVLDNVPTRMDMDSMSGDLDITLPETAGFTVTMDTMSSDFTSDFETTIKNGNYTHGDGSCRINVDAMSGDVTIRAASVVPTVPEATTAPEAPTAP